MSNAQSSHRTAQRGFTLIELLTVMTIMALEQFQADRGKYPTSLGQLRDERYLREIPVDPMTQSKDTWVSEYESPDQDNPDSEVGIFRIRSGSTDVGENQVPYNEW